MGRNDTLAGKQKRTSHLAQSDLQGEAGSRHEGRTVKHARQLVLKRKSKMKVDAAREGMIIQLGGKNSR